MKIRKVEEKPMVLHTRKKPTLHIQKKKKLTGNDKPKSYIQIRGKGRADKKEKADFSAIKKLVIYCKSYFALIVVAIIALRPPNACNLNSAFTAFFFQLIATITSQPCRRYFLFFD